jgi:hypothetical protein
MEARKWIIDVDRKELVFEGDPLPVQGRDACRGVSGRPACTYMLNGV